MANTWLNSDGLFVRFGRMQGTVGGSSGIGYAGEYDREVDGTHIVEAVFNTMTSIPLLSAIASGNSIVDDNVWIPNGARIEQVVTQCFTVVTGSSTTLDVGLISQDRATEVDYNGFVIAMPLTSIDAAGETTILTAGSTYAGALIGTTLSTTGGSLISVNYNTAAFTAGVLKVRIYYSMPASSTSP